jgi:hypothetical protein
MQCPSVPFFQAPGTATRRGTVAGATGTTQDLGFGFPGVPGAVPCAVEDVGQSRAQGRAHLRGGELKVRLACS